MTYQMSQLERSFLRLALGEILNLTSKDPVLAKSTPQLLRESGLPDSCITDRHLLEVYQELLSEQELR